MLLTGVHIRMARAALGWSVAETAEKSGVSTSTIKRIESAETGVPNVFTSNLDALKQLFERSGIAFLEPDGKELGPGVALKIEGNASMTFGGLSMSGFGKVGK